MDHADHVALLREGIPSPGGTWADFGSGTGAFTLALAELIGPNREIHSVDKNRRRLQEQERKISARFPEQRVHYLHADYTRSIALPRLDGIIMANALHFQRKKEAVIASIHEYLRPRRPPDSGGV